ncbi:MAG: copper resistance CopC family protein [Maricaulaceae bacterium]
MNMKFIAVSLLALTALFVTEPAWAHTKVKTSTLEDGKTYQTLPETLDLVFAQKVGLIALSLETDDGSEFPLSFDKPKGMHSRFAIPKPDLDPGTYVIKWRVMAKDGHVMNGEIAFTYEP